MGVTMAPGATLLTVMPRGPSSTARLRMSMRRPPLEAAVSGEVGEDHVFVDGADVDDAAGLFGVGEAATKAWVRKKAPLRLTLRTRS